LALSRDLARFERLGRILPPEDKDAALFPEPIGGRWACLHRPVRGPEYVRRDVWLSFSRDLRRWEGGRPLLAARRGCWWDADKIGAGPPPLATEAGWLVGYHGVKATVAGGIYRFGLALLDRRDPFRVLGRTSAWCLAPEAPYERVGDVPNVVFPCGWLVREGVVHLYYGGADTCVCLATAPLERLLAALR
ncbi:MAG: glycosidase, partial [Nitrospirae bacterium]